MALQEMKESVCTCAGLVALTLRYKTGFCIRCELMYLSPWSQLFPAKVGHIVICRPFTAGGVLLRRLQVPTTKRGCSHSPLVTSCAHASTRASVAEITSHALPNGATLEVIRQLADEVGTLVLL